MQTIVITGSTRGLGLGLAQAFRARGCAVTVSGRTPEGVAAAVEVLRALPGQAPVHGQTCDVSQAAQVQALWDSARAALGRVDVWINNAGFSPVRASIDHTPPEAARAAVETNLLGAIYGARAALAGMRAQGGGQIYNVEGMGSDGQRHAGMTFYGMTKYGLRYFTRCLVDETRNTPVVVGSLRPGMLLTDMILDQYRDRPQDWERDRRVFDILAERVEVVAPWLADQVLANRRHGARIAWLTPARMLRRMLRLPFARRAQTP